jgi:hypothetical protein
LRPEQPKRYCKDDEKGWFAHTPQGYPFANGRPRHYPTSSKLGAKRWSLCVWLSTNRSGRFACSVVTWLEWQPIIFTRLVASLRPPRS